MGGSLSNLRVVTDHPPDLRRLLAVVGLKAALVNEGLARLKAEGTAKKGDKAKASQDYSFPVLAKEVEQGKGDKTDEDEC